MDERTESISQNLCPEIKEAYLVLDKHFHECEKCKKLLTGYASPLYIEMLWEQGRLEKAAQCIAHLVELMDSFRRRPENSS